MKPIKFKGQNRTYLKPPQMTEEECGSLHVNQTGNEIVSCWELDENDIKDIVENKRIWVGVIARKQPPIYLLAQEPLQVSQQRVEDAKTDDDHD